MRFFLQPLLCLQIAPTQVIVRNLRNNTTLTEPAELALDRQGNKPRLLGFGGQARAAAAAEAGAQLLRPFAHPRSLVSDFLSAELLLRAMVRQSLGKGLLAAGIDPVCPGAQHRDRAGCAAQGAAMRRSVDPSCQPAHDGEALPRQGVGEGPGGFLPAGTG